MKALKASYISQANEEIYTENEEKEGKSFLFSLLYLKCHQLFQVLEDIIFFNSCFVLLEF